jgi:hypothetical protein
MSALSPEHFRLEQDRGGQLNWRRWGPYVSERSWGTVREDYSPDGEAWSYLTHDHARSKAYRWGEDGLAGICDRYQILVFSLAMWNHQDPFLKERLFGLVPQQANHGEDVKEYYYYLDATPTASYLRFLYKYPQRPFPYDQLIEQNKARSREDREYELMDTGVFDDDRYFDVQVEYAKQDPNDICIRIEVFNRGCEAAPIRMLPHLWFRNTWGWEQHRHPEPSITCKNTDDALVLIADPTAGKPIGNLLHPYKLGRQFLYADRGASALFTNNESNAELLYQSPSASPYVKDAFHRYVVGGEDAINPRQVGTKACIDFGTRQIPAGGSCKFLLRLSDREIISPLASAEAVVDLRQREADQFYDVVHPSRATDDERLVQRQALAGMIWSKQIYLFDVRKWLEGDNPDAPPPASRRTIRNRHWLHLNSMRILSMPDKWEYPWFAAWDLAFQAIPLALVDPEFAKEQLWLLLFEQFQHPNGQLPAYEWEFSDLNPPVHAWAVWRVFNMERKKFGREDRRFLETCFHKLMLNFTWWINKVDSEGQNVFEGGFLGLDNIATFDRSARPADGTVLKQADATAWMGMFCLNMMRIALELAKENRAYAALATKFFEHYVYIGAAMKNMGGKNFQLWSDQDGLFCDVLVYPDGSHQRFGLRSLVSLIPLYAVEYLDKLWIKQFADFGDNVAWFMRNRQEMTQACISEYDSGASSVFLLGLLDEPQLKQILATVWSPDEFRSPFGLRSLSKYHESHPFKCGDQIVRYEPAESTDWLKGGNSNWRGPVWFPTTFLMIESLRKLSKVYGNDLQISTEGGQPITLMQMAAGFADRLISLFVNNESNHRPIFGDSEKLQSDPLWHDLLTFHEYFNAETGEGLGASHQTGWTGLVATLIDEWRQ